jgi:hypothetical protein
VSAGPEPRAEVTGQCADIGAGGAFDQHVDVDPGGLAAQAEQVEAVHGDRPGGDLHLLAGPHPGVGALAVDLDRAHRARHLLDRTGQRGDAGQDVVVGDGIQPGAVHLRQNFALGVVGRGGGAEPDRGQVGLAVQREVAEQLGGALDAEHQHPGGHRVERAGVAHLAGAHDPADPRHHVVRGHPARLVDDDQSRLHNRKA